MSAAQMDCSAASTVKYLNEEDQTNINTLLESIKNFSEAANNGSAETNHKDSQLSQKRSIDEKEDEKVPGVRKFKKKKVVKAFAFKTALMKLNESFPGLKYEVESIGGPAHQPVFKASVVVENQKFEGEGKSKQIAKLAAAEVALRSFIQFPDMAEAQQVLHHTQNILKGDIDTHNSKQDVTDASAKGNEDQTKPFHHVASSPKNPVMLLNEMLPGLEFVLIEEKGSPHAKTFTMCVEHDGESYIGHGNNKKVAKAAAASQLLSKKFSINVSTTEIGKKSSFPGTDSLTSDLVVPVPQEFADQLESTINLAFEDLMKEIPNYKKHKVLAGIVMTNDVTQEMKVICVTTGTKCINGEHISVHGAAINDCHAEIISRRCLIDYLYTELENMDMKTDKSIFDERIPGRYCVKPEVKFHLYINTAPCGDARIFSPKETSTPDRHPLRKCRGQLRTKIESGEGTIPVVNSENSLQTWDSILAGNRLLTMSCSDKVARWMVVGLQGALLSHLIDPVYLETVTLGSLYHPEHMHRALCGRFSANLDTLPSPYELRQPAMALIRNIKIRQPNKAPNHCVNWTTGNIAPEVVNAITGKIDAQTPSRLCKRAFFKRFKALKENFSGLRDVSDVYSEAKTASTDYQAAKKAFSEAFVRAGLGKWMKKPMEQDQFSLEELDAM